jgi:Cu+-exporting ATPase
VVVGKRELAERMHVRGLSPLLAEAEKLQNETLVYVAVDGKAAGLIALSDPIKATAPDAVKKLQRLGVHLILMSGDHFQAAQAVADLLKIDTVYGNASPEDKCLLVQKLKAQKQSVAMAGDGINDAPALAAADVGIAMGNGTDIALESAGIALVKGDLAGIARAIILSRATMRNIRQNLFFAFIYNAVGIAFAAGLFYPFFGILLNPMLASAAMALSSLSVIFNASRLSFQDFRPAQCMIFHK